MGGIVSAIGDVVGGVADAVGSVAEGVVDVAGSVVEAVADNPLLAVAAVATPFALSAMAAEAAGAAAVAEGAAVGDAMTAGSILGGGLTGAQMATADMIGGALVNQSLVPTVLQGIGGIGAGAGIGGAGAVTEGLTPVGPNWTPTPVDASTLDSATAGGWTPGSAIDSSLNAAVPDASVATEQGTAVLDSTGSNIAINDAATHASESIINAAPTTDLSTAITQAKDAVDLTQAGIPVDTSVATATNGTVNVNPLTELASSTTSNVKDAWNFLSSGAQNISKSIGETVLPGADPAIQKYAGQFVVNTGTNVATGQDFSDALTNAGIGVGTGAFGNEVSSITGSPMVGKAVGAGTNVALHGGDPTAIAGGVGSSLLGSEVSNLTGSPIAGNVSSVLANSAITGSDPTMGLINTGVNTVVPSTGATSLLKPFISAGLNQAFAPKPNVPTSNLPTTPTKTAYVPPAKMDISQLIPLNNLPKTTTTTAAPTPTTTTTASAPAYVAPQHVDVSTLSPVTNIAGLTAILNAKKATA